MRGRKGQKGYGDEEFGREQERGRKGNSGKNRGIGRKKKGKVGGEEREREGKVQSKLEEGKKRV